MRPIRSLHGCLVDFARALLLPVLLALPAGAYEAPSPKSPVPQHASPWVETRKLDLETVFLWKFNSDKDREAEISLLLERADLGALLETKPTDKAGPGDSPEKILPELQGDARLAAGVGRYGGALELDGKGFARSSPQLKKLLTSHGGFTLDFWFRSSKGPVPREKALLAAVPDEAGGLLLGIYGDGAAVGLTVSGVEQLRVPVRETADGWHHLVWCVDTPQGIFDRSTLCLIVDGETLRAERPEHTAAIPWFKGVPTRLGQDLFVGGMPAGSGWRGLIDEVRLTRGMKHFYPWGLGAQERSRRPEELELRAPFFKGARVLTRFRFEGSLEPEVFAGRSWKGTASAEHFPPGLNGRCLDLSRIDKTGFQLQGFHILPEKNGAVEFWFRPLDWNNFYMGEYDGRDVKPEFLLTLTSKEAPYATPTKNIEIMKGRSWKDRPMRWHQIHPGAWTHVLVSLKDGAQSVYLNGVPQKFWQSGLVIRGHPHSREPLTKWRERTGGEDVDDTWSVAFPSSHTLLDEFSVFSAPFSPEEAWNAYARWLPDSATQMKPLPLFRLDFDYFAHSWTMQERLQIRLACLPAGDTPPATADCEVRDASGSPLLALEKQPLDAGGGALFSLDRALPFGRYTVRVRSRDASGNILHEHRQDYVRERPEWLDNTLGNDRTVPKPWTPLTVEARSLRVVGREISLGPNGLPSAIRALGEEVLAAPLALRAGSVELTGSDLTFTETAPDRASWRCALRGGPLRADLEAWMEFDGLLRCDITLKPAAGAEAKVDDLHVSVPMTGAVATQLLANGGGKDFRTSWIARAVPKGSGPVWNSLDKPYPAFTRAFEVTNFMPHIWLGNDSVGLYFGAENDQGWTVDGPVPAQQILREGEDLVFRMNILREPTSIPLEGRRFHFLLLPTPAKPEPPDWRKQMLSKVNFTAVDTFSGFDLKTDPADPRNGDAFRLEPRSWEIAAEAAQKCRTKNEANGLCILYADASFPGLGPAFRDWSHHMWADTGKLAWTPEFEDYAVWAIHNFLQRGLIDGVYWDDVSVGNTLLFRGGAYAYPEGSKGRRVGFTALAQRRVNMRLWRLFEAAGKEPCIWAHMTVCYEIPVFSFCRYLSNCEFVTGVNMPGKRDAMDMWSADVLRILGGAAKWGTGYHNLSTLPRSLPASAAAAQWAYPQKRTETALYLTNDQWGPADNLGQMLLKEKVFEGPVHAWPWWKAGEVLTLTTPSEAQPLSAVYARDGRAIVIVANRDRSAAHAFQIELDSAKLFPGARGVLWRDLDPGLTPPKEATALAKDIGDFAPKTQESGRKKPADIESVDDLLEGSTPAKRQESQLQLRTQNNAASVLVRPRDYRILEARAIH